MIFHCRGRRKEKRTGVVELSKCFTREAVGIYLQQPLTRFYASAKKERDGNFSALPLRAVFASAKK